MPRKKQAPKPLGEVDPKAPAPPEDLNTETVEEAQPEQVKEDQPEPEVEIEVPEVEPEPPGSSWKKLPEMCDDHNIAEGYSIKARQVFKMIVRFRDPESGKVIDYLVFDRLQVHKDAATGEYEILSRM